MSQGESGLSKKGFQGMEEAGGGQNWGPLLVGDVEMDRADDRWRMEEGEVSRFAGELRRKQTNDRTTGTEDCW